ncbi:MAG: phosphoserine phosphatase SerB [Hyphomicrobiales bacterium]|nr:phosphoserine phosphatase SerB [Hyphomicrobiales bacterium]
MPDAAFALTLIAAPGSAEVLREAAARVQVIAPGEPTWLAEGEALDIAFVRSEPLDALRRAALDAVAGLPVDAVIQPAAGRRKRLLVADMDSTVIEQECIDEMAALMGAGAQVAAITERAMRGELDFEAALAARLKMLRGFGPEHVEAVLARVTLTPGAETLAATMRANGGACVLVSGGFTAFTAPVAARVGFDAHHGNTLIFHTEGLEVARPILGREAKAGWLAREAAARGLTLAETMAVGDGANDLAMLGAAGLGVAFRAKPAVAEAADVSIARGDLTALLYLQGYRRQDFAQ